MRYKLPLCLVVPVLLMLFGCAQTAKESPAPYTTETVTPEGYSFPHPSDAAEPTVHGAWVVRSGTSLCVKCHKSDTDTTLPGPACNSCHSVYPHAEGWATAGLHSLYVDENGRANCQGTCHGTDLAGGLSGVSCTKCHETYPHVTGWTDTQSAQFHGITALGDGKNVCKLCHGDNFAGGQSDVTCYNASCHAPYPHAEGWLAAGASAHGPVVNVEGSSQCESCHGTNNSGSIFSSFCNDCHNQHLSSPTTCKGCHESGKGLPSGSYRPSDSIHPATTDCVTCHDYATGDFKILRGETIDFTQSPHASATGAFAKKSASTTCMRCHTATGFKDYIHDEIQGAAALASATTPDPLTCTACHNADTAAYATTGVVIKTTSNMSLSANMEGLCIRCHSGRSGEGSLKARAAVNGQALDTVMSGTYTYAQWPANTTAGGTTSPATNRNAAVATHYFPVANIFYGSDAGVGYEYTTETPSKTYVGKNNLMEGYETCIKCHNPHTAAVNLTQCVACHTNVTTDADLVNIRKTTSDYDGDGDTSEGTSYEVAGVQAKLLQVIQSYALNVPASPTGIIFTPGDKWYKTGTTTTFAQWTPRLVKAAFNYQLVYRDPAAYIHNSKYVVELLYDSIEDLNAGLDATGHAANKVSMTGMVRP